MSHELFADCFVCGQSCPVETPPCPDGHEDCADRVCTRCGTALFVDPFVDIELKRTRDRNPSVGAA